ncbi:cell wall-active antibiotics response protein [Reichenbachiella carrageenanivorans]|uniref:Cell wall-active antibiotics response protein n=1 Tax=Reichenbachiella carrageenanivorans TaxID=2979869 RepID=A0ABY6CWJ2_9BACT|nr:cell wall-active antibiotics response protein [Reichenbachiella carrageenanivorans]UXX78284.1 cell wall-active antibiotics response protein [Reichenbachiella carrageenanivorans]
MSRHTTPHTSQTGSSRSSILGILLIISGGLFLLDNFNLIPYEISDYLFNWKGLMLLIGTVFLTTKDNKTPGLTLLVVGGFFILSDVMSYEFGWHWYDTRKLFWPVLLIIIGLVIISRRGNSEKAKGHIFEADHESSKIPNDKDHLNITAALGGGDVSIQSQNFQGGKVTVLMGGGTYDLSGSDLAEGTQEIDLMVLMGGANFIVPSDWNVRIEVTSLFGGYSDSRKFNAETPTDSTKELLIKGTVLFGGGEVKNYL